MRNRIHVKARKAGISLKFYGCDFIQFDTGDGSTPRMFIWLVPISSQTNAGEGFCVDSCKFGPENQLATDYRIVYANELSGTYNADCFPNLTTESTYFVTGHSIVNCKIGGATSIPIIYSMTNLVEDILFDNITIQGAAPSHLIKVFNVRTNGNYAVGNVTVGNFITNAGQLTVGIPISNQTFSVMMNTNSTVFDSNEIPVEYAADSTARVGYK